MAFSDDGFDRTTALPPGLTVAHIKSAIEFVEDKAAEWIDLYFEQANIFSAVVGILGVRALDSFSPYKKHKHPDVAQQRFPDLSLRGKVDPPPLEALESKGSTRPWAIQSHYNHPGWYIVWRYAIDATKRMKRGKPVLVWRVDIPFLEADNWKYEGSKAAEGTGGKNTHVRREESCRRDREEHRLPGSRGALIEGQAVLDRSLYIGVIPPFASANKSGTIVT